MNEIRQLPTSVINKIAAGEVIERPASVVKELLENSVDAGASRIDVALEQGGTVLVRVVDNGSGIPLDQLPLAVASHATSKICGADDLFSVKTLGFRGEALASIAEVSQFRLRSRTASADAGGQLDVNGGRAEPVQPCASGLGTTIEVRNLFFNTPVRRKFLRTTQTEMGHCSEAFTRIALAHEHIHFSLRHNERQIYDLPPTADWRERIATFFGSELAGALIEVDGHDETIRVSGYVADPSQSRSNNRMQYLFLNGRHIRDRSLQHSLGEAYRGLLMTGRYPITFLRLEMPSELIDVNVHPTKLEVRFQDSGRVYSQLLGTLRTQFLSTDLTAKVHAAQLDVRQPVGIASGVAGSRAVDAAVGSSALNSPRLDFGTAAQSVGRSADSFLPGLTPRRASSDTGVNWSTLDDNHAADSGRSADNPLPAAGVPVRSTAMQVHNRYLIAESDEGVVVIDQHALHERILYEQLRGKVLSRSVETQKLLVPEPVQLTSAEAATILDGQQLLAELGIEVASFGGDTVLVSAYPSMLANLGPAELLRQLAEQMMVGEKAPDRRDILDSLLHMISCKAAIKAGDRLSPEEVAALVQQRDHVQDGHHCPHGRPTSLIFTREELDRRFKRV